MICEHGNEITLIKSFGEYWSIVGCIDCSINVYDMENLIRPVNHREFFDRYQHLEEIETIEPPEPQDG